MWNTDSVFHEKQDGRLCAQHCLNATLQGSYFSAVDLSELALRLDEDERLRMAENGIDSIEYRKFVEQPSGNMDDTGFFSIQVISRALSVWGLEIIPLNSSDPLAQQCRQDPTKANGYILNMESHWFCIRRFAEMWFNLNSLLKKPKFMSSIYITEYLKQMENDGYSIFIVSGQLPECQADRIPPTMRPTNNRFIDLTQPSTRITGHQGIKLGEIEDSTDTDPELSEAIKMSMECFSDAPVVVPNAQELRERRLAFFNAAKPYI